MACKEGYNKGTKLSYCQTFTFCVVPAFLQSQQYSFTGEIQAQLHKGKLADHGASQHCNLGTPCESGLEQLHVELILNTFNDFPHFSLYVFKKGVPRPFHSTAHSHGLLCFSNQGRKWSNHDKDLARICKIKLSEGNLSFFLHAVFNYFEVFICLFITSAKLVLSLTHPCCILYMNVTLRYVLCSDCCWFSSALSAGQWNLSTSLCFEHTKRSYGVFC